MCEFNKPKLQIPKCFLLYHFLKLSLAKKLHLVREFVLPYQPHLYYVDTWWYMLDTVKLLFLDLSIQWLLFL